MELEELRRRRLAISARANRHLSNMNAIAAESGRVADVAANAEVILRDIDEQFESCTGLTKLDISFLFVAVALQVIRQYIFTKFPERLGGCKIFCVYGNETFQIRIRYVVVFVGFCSRIFCRIYLSGYSISCPLSFIHAF